MSVLSIIFQIANFSQLYQPHSLKAIKPRALGSGPSLAYPCGFVDGASAKNIGGVGFCLYQNKSLSFEFALGAGSCTNTKEELIGLWDLLHISQVMGIPTLHILGDSSVIINWAKGTDALSPSDLNHWCRDIRKLNTFFIHLSFYHIYREHN